jgi:hypothetical protein
MCKSIARATVPQGVAKDICHLSSVLHILQTMSDGDRGTLSTAIPRIK